MHLTLVLLAAGRSTRYGGLKQLEAFGPGGEMIMDYTIADAVEAGFTKVVLVVSADHRDEFAAKLELHALRDRFQLAFTIQEERLGTGDAARSAASEVNEPFALLNSDDYYGNVNVFRQAADFLSTVNPAEQPMKYALLGYPLGETIPAAGNVSRGICTADESRTLSHLQEVYELHRSEGGSVLGKDATGNAVILTGEELCSMQFWLLAPGFMNEVEKDFQEYLAKPRLPGRAGEFLLTNVIEEHRASGRAQITVLPIAKADCDWCGVTNPEDRVEVMAKLAKKHAEGMYGRLRLPC